MSPTETAGQGLERGVAAQNSAADPTEVQAILATWWKELLDLDEVGPDDDFFDLGGNSLVSVHLFSAIKQRFGLSFSVSLLFDAPTIRLLAEQIRAAGQPKKSESKQSSVIVPLQPKGSRPPLFWIPGGLGASVLVFREISLLLGPDRPVYAFEVLMPEREAGMESTEERATFFIKEMRALQPEGPYHLIGFCGGGYIAYEMAQQLSAQGQPVGFLGIIDCVDPHYPHNWKESLRFNSERAVWRVGRFLDRGPMGIAQWFLDQSRKLGKALLFDNLRAKARDLERPLPPASETAEEYLEKAWRNAERYFPVPYSGNCVVFLGKDSYLYAGLSASTDPRLVWCRLSKGGSEVRIVPGDHLEMLNPPNVSVFAETLNHFLR